MPYIQPKMAHPLFLLIWPIPISTQTIKGVVIATTEIANGFTHVGVFSCYSKITILDWNMISLHTCTMKSYFSCTNRGWKKMKIRFCCRLYNKIMFLLHHHVCNENTIPFVILSMKSYFHSSLSLFESFLSSFLLPLPYMLILPRLILSHTHTHTQRPMQDNIHQPWWQFKITTFINNGNEAQIWPMH